MFQITEAAREELHNRLSAKGPGARVRLGMSTGCFQKVRVSVEEGGPPGEKDAELEVGGLPFRIDTGLMHFFRNRTLDYRPDPTGFKEFDLD